MADSESWDLYRRANCGGECESPLHVEGKNALGLAAQHADKYGCPVDVEIGKNVRFTSEK